MEGPDTREIEAEAAMQVTPYCDVLVCWQSMWVDSEHEKKIDEHVLIELYENANTEMSGVQLLGFFVLLCSTILHLF